MRTDLRFPLADGLDLVERALTPTDHTNPDRQPHGPALWWTVDDGVFLTATASGTTRVHAQGFGPGTAWTDLALAGLNATGPQPIALTGPSGEDLAGHLREAAAHHQPWALLRLPPGYATLTATTRLAPTVARAVRDGQDPVAVSIEDRTGDPDAAGRPWQTDLTHPDDVIADLADILNTTAETHTDVTAELLGAAGQLRGLANDIISDVTTRGTCFHHGPVDAAAIRLRVAAARHEVTANTLTQLWAAWRNAQARRGTG